MKPSARIKAADANRVIEEILTSAGLDATPRQVKPKRYQDLLTGLRQADARNKSGKWLE